MDQVIAVTPACFNGILYPSNKLRTLKLLKNNLNFFKRKNRLNLDSQLPFKRMRSPNWILSIILKSGVPFVILLKLFNYYLILRMKLLWKVEQRNEEHIPLIISEGHSSHGPTTTYF